MKLYAGCVRLPGAPDAVAALLDRHAVAHWILLPPGSVLAVALGSHDGLSELGAHAADWEVPPTPILQLGYRPENPANYGRLVTGWYHPGVGPDAAQVSRSLLPAVARREGFAATVVAEDRVTGRTFSLSAWASESAAHANVTDGWFATQVAKFADYYTGAPSTVNAPLWPGAAA